MSTKTANKNATPKITKKWYDFKIDENTLRPIRFSWELASGIKEVYVYDSEDKPRVEVKDVGLRNYVTSYYFVLDKTNKRIFAYPVQLVKNRTRSECEDAHWEAMQSNEFYMFDENKQMWAIPRRAYQRYVRYDWNQRQAIYENVEATPRKINRLSTAYYKTSCQLTEYVKNTFGYLYGKDFVYQNRVVTDNDIRESGYMWTSWLMTKGRKYSDKTVRAADEIMNKFCSERRERFDGQDKKWYVCVSLETLNGVTALCYFSEGQETFRQVFNAKTGRFENFIWKNGKWSKSNKLSDYQNIEKFQICGSYIDTHEYDYMFFKEATQQYKDNRDNRRYGYWYSPQTNLYKFVVRYLSHPVVHQLLQIQSEAARQEMYKNRGDIEQFYGKIPNRGKTMYAKLGVNKYQFRHTGSVIVYMKWLLDKTNISHMDDATWDKCCAAFDGESINQYNDSDIIKYLKGRGEFSIDRWIKICQLDKSYRNPNSYYRNSGSVKQLYKDYYRSLDAMSEFGIDISAYPLLFNDQAQLQRYHDEAARAVSAVRNKAQDEKFEILFEKRQKMLEDDGKHMITMPKCSSDLVEEGSHLHHCVGGYVNSVANGNTAIYFLRQSDAPDTPWLTVEVSNKQCRQIHGACNAWMGSSDEYFAAVPFLVWWFDKHGIECSDNLLTNMATGYGQSSNRRAMPTEAIERYKALRKLKKSS